MLYHITVECSEKKCVQQCRSIFHIINTFVYQYFFQFLYELIFSYHHFLIYSCLSNLNKQVHPFLFVTARLIRTTSRFRRMPSRSSGLLRNFRMQPEEDDVTEVLQDAMNFATPSYLHRIFNEHYDTKLFGVSSKWKIVIRIILTATLFVAALYTGWRQYNSHQFDIW